MNHNYIKIDELNEFMLKCKTCGLVRDIYYDEDTDSDINIFYYRGENCSDDMNDWIEINYEISCNEMIIKNIIE